MVVVLSSQEFRPSNELWPGGRTCVTMQLAPLRSRCRNSEVWKSGVVTLWSPIGTRVRWLILSVRAKFGLSLW
ncbi:hypothetical protein MtrunA17_Chr8g0357381 [Medicago truncatula]|uniref:Uncharacterized protein n=1 Tax=Medicago truncatula TaxID=3880 RepID=A0A396GHK5_MEDTR|nr:hypothetical protein MtrunA17_Chr8g0357381 [Medicago truncatula]